MMGLGEIFAELEALARAYPGLAPDVAIQFGDKFQDELGRAYAYELREARMHLEKALLAAREAVRPKLTVVPPEGSR